MAANAMQEEHDYRAHFIVTNGFAFAEQTCTIHILNALRSMLVMAFAIPV
jgi:hypothetical protein